MSGMRIQIKDLLERELGASSDELLEEFLDGKKDGINKDRVEELEDHIFEKVKEERGVEKAEEIVDEIKKIKLSEQLKELREKSKSKIQIRSRYEVLKRLGDVCVNLNHLEEAEDHFDEMLEISEEFVKKEMIIDSLQAKAELYLLLGELSKVEKNARRMIKLARESGDIVMEGKGIKLAGIVAWRKGDHREGMNYLKDSLEMFKKGWRKASVYRELGDLHVDAGDYEESLEYYEKAAEVFGEAEMLYERVNMLLEVGMILSEIEKDGTVKYLEAAEKEALENSFFDFAGWSSLNLGEIYLEDGRIKKAEEKSRIALELFEKVRDEHGKGGVELTLGRAIAVKGEVAEAERVLKDALTIFSKLGLSESQAEALYRLAQVQREKGDMDGAKTNLEEALKIYDGLDMAEMKAEIEEKLDDLTKYLK
ncbi:MAG: tetratricopeptide repeat protein [Candidatus Natronoplasma sp.]